MKESAGNCNYAKQAAQLLEVGCSFKKKIQIEQQKIMTNDQRIKFLEKEIEQMKQQNKIKKQKLNKVHQLIEKQKKKSQSKPTNEIIHQLRQHFKALRFQLANMLEDQEQDDVDVDNMTYQELLELGQKMGKVSKGIQQNKFDELKKIPFVKKQSKDHQCTICRDQFNQEDQCIKLSCEHLFHVQCVKQWLKMEKVCPNCKSEIS